jgi:hypothetical protein
MTGRQGSFSSSINQYMVGRVAARSDWKGHHELYESRYVQRYDVFVLGRGCRWKEEWRRVMERITDDEY